MSWKNKVGTSDRSCSCGSWRNHWINISKMPWPKSCAVSNCEASPTVGGHVIHSSISGERIVPMCDSCNKLNTPFELKGNISMVLANKSFTCGG